MTSTRDTTATPPPHLHTLSEIRALWEAGSFISLRPLMKSFARGDGHPVLLLPGFMASDVGMSPLRSVLTDLGHSALPWELGRHTQFCEIKAGILAERIETLYKQTGQKISLVGWSMGGILARELAKKIPDRIRTVVTLGSPIAADLDFTIAKRFYELINGSTEKDPTLLANLPKPPPVPTTTIYSRNDGIVSWRGVVQKKHSDSPQTENVRISSSHIGMVVNPLAIFVVANRLAQKEGEWNYFQGSPLTDFFIQAHR